MITKKIEKSLPEQMMDILIDMYYGNMKTVERARRLFVFFNSKHSEDYKYLEVITDLIRQSGISDNVAPSDPDAFTMLIHNSNRVSRIFRLTNPPVKKELGDRRKLRYT